jgi:hypothetical protein
MRLFSRSFHAGFFLISRTIASIIFRIPAIIRQIPAMRSACRPAYPATSRATPIKKNNATITILLILLPPTKSIAARKLPDTLIDGPLKRYSHERSKKKRNSPHIPPDYAGMIKKIIITLIREPRECLTFIGCTCPKIAEITGQRASSQFQYINGVYVFQKPFCVFCRCS